MNRTAVACTTEQTLLGEGARWDDRRDELLRVDIVAGRVFRDRVNEDGSLVPVRTYQVPGTVGAIAPVAGDDGWLLALGRGFGHLTREGVFHRLPEATPVGTRMNDVACDRQGRFWAGTLADDHRAGGGALYRLDCDGQIEMVLSGLTIANGLGWSPDGATMYLADSGPRLIHAFDFDTVGGTLSRARVLVSLEREIGAPDGLTVDAAGDLWVAVYGGGCVRRYSADGVLRETLTVPAEQCTSCVFAGPGLHQLFVTTGTENWSDEQRRAEPAAGLVYRFDTDATGRARVALPTRTDLVEGSSGMKRVDHSEVPGMTDFAVKFFEELGHKSHEPLLAKVTGRVRFDLVDGPHTDSWLVTIDKGDLSVSHDSGNADCTVRGEKVLFDELACGGANPMSSVLRGALTCTGEVELLIAIQRLFPAPPRQQEPKSSARSTS